MAWEVEGIEGIGENSRKPRTQAAWEKWNRWEQHEEIAKQDYQKVMLNCYALCILASSDDNRMNTIFEQCRRNLEESYQKDKQKEFISPMALIAQSLGAAVSIVGAVGGPVGAAFGNISATTIQGVSTGASQAFTTTGTALTASMEKKRDEAQYRETIESKLGDTAERNGDQAKRLRDEAIKTMEQTFKSDSELKRVLYGS